MSRDRVRWSSPETLKVALASATSRRMQLRIARPDPFVVVAVPPSVSPVSGDAAEADVAGAANTATAANAGDQGESVTPGPQKTRKTARHGLPPACRCCDARSREMLTESMLRAGRSRPVTRRTYRLRWGGEL